MIPEMESDFHTNKKQMFNYLQLQKQMAQNRTFLGHIIVIIVAIPVAQEKPTRWPTRTAVLEPQLQAPAKVHVIVHRWSDRGDLLRRFADLGTITTGTNGFLKRLLDIQYIIIYYIYICC